MEDPILRYGGMKIFPWYSEDFMMKVGKDFLDELEDYFYPAYMYAESNEKKSMLDLLDLASADLPILKDEQFMMNSK